MNYYRRIVQRLAPTTLGLNAIWWAVMVSHEGDGGEMVTAESEVTAYSLKEREKKRLKEDDIFVGFATRS